LKDTYQSRRRLRYQYTTVSQTGNEFWISLRVSNNDYRDRN